MLSCLHSMVIGRKNGHFSFYKFGISWELLNLLLKISYLSWIHSSFFFFFLENYIYAILNDLICYCVHSCI